METIYSDVSKNGSKVYYQMSFGRHFRMANTDAEFALATGKAEEAAYLPNKPYQAYTLRQLNAALEALKDSASAARLINAEIEARLNKLT